MQIRFQSKKVEKVFSSAKELGKQYGQRLADVIRRRMAALTAAEVLEDLRHVPGRLHELTGNRAAQLAFDLVHPQRLVFEPENKTEFRKPDGGWDWSKVESVIVIEVVDYH